MDGQVLVFAAVVAARFGVPLLIPLFPLPALVAALVLDGVDQTIFQAFGYDPPGYQGYDKAMDVYYLAIAYLATMRNWTSQPAVRVARFLYFYRLAGVVAFQLTHWRALLLVFPNTFEYFFIAYEVVRLLWRPERFGARFWVVAAAIIWVVVKLPQEYWIHVAKLDVTDLLGEHPWAGVAVAAALAAAGLGAWSAGRHRLPARDRGWHVAADPLPEEMDTAAERAGWIAGNVRLRSLITAEKVLLVALLSVTFGQVLPGRSTTDLELVVGLGAFVVVNAAVSLWAARGTRTLESALAAFGVRVLLNVGLVVVSQVLVGRGDLNVGNALFFVLLLSLITLLDDRFRPVHGVRFPPRERVPTATSAGRRPR